MRRLMLIPALVGLLIAGAMYAQDAGGTGAPGVGDSLYPESGNGGYDVQNYTLDLIWNARSGALQGQAMITANALQDLIAFNLDFVGFTISEITINGTLARYSRDGGELTVVVPDGETLSPGREFTVTVAYSGVPVGVSGNNPLGGWNQVENTVFVASQPVGARTWFPANDHPSDKATFNFRVTVPQPFVVAANGVPAEPVFNEDTNAATYIFTASDPMAPYLATVNIAEFRVEEQTGADGLRFVNYFPDGYDGTEDFELQDEMITFFSEVYGPYPFEISGAVVVDIPLGFALETQTRPLYGTNTAFERIIAHELVHQWFGNSLALEDWRDIWLNEGFATYGEGLWIENTDGPDALDETVRNWYTQMASNALFVLSKDEFLAQAPALPSADLNRTQLGLLLPLLLGDSVPGEDINAVLADVPDEGINAQALGELVADLNFEQIAFTPERYLGFFGMLGIEDLPPREQLTNRLLPPGSPTPDRLFNGAVYQRGALTLHALRLQVGDEMFFDILQTYNATFEGDNVNTDEFIGVAEDISGDDLGAFFDAWLYDEAIPDIPEMDLYREDFQFD